MFEKTLGDLVRGIRAHKGNEVSCRVPLSFDSFPDSHLEEYYYVMVTVHAVCQ